MGQFDCLCRQCPLPVYSILVPFHDLAGIYLTNAWSSCWVADWFWLELTSSQCIELLQYSIAGSCGTPCIVRDLVQLGIGSHCAGNSAEAVGFSSVVRINALQSISIMLSVITSASRKFILQVCRLVAAVIVQHICPWHVMRYYSIRPKRRPGQR